MAYVSSTGLALVVPMSNSSWSTSFATLISTVVKTETSISSAHRTDFGLEVGLDLLLVPKKKDWVVESRDGGDLERAERSGVDRDEEEGEVEFEFEGEGENGGIVLDFRTEDA
jgi:hypothetical protein